MFIVRIFLFSALAFSIFPNIRINTRNPIEAIFELIRMYITIHFNQQSPSPSFVPERFSCYKWINCCRAVLIVHNIFHTHIRHSRLFDVGQISIDSSVKMTNSIGPDAIRNRSN